MADATKFIEMPETEIKEKQTLLQFVSPGFSLESFDRTENISPWMMAKTFQLARTCAFAHPEYCSHQIRLYHSNGPMGWTTLAQYDFRRGLYTKTKGKNKFNLPVILSNRLAKIGTTSLDFYSDVVDKSDDETLATLKFKYVLVNRESRKSTPVPLEFKQKYSNFLKTELGIGSMKFPDRPIATYSMTHRLRPSDIDHNGHLNNTYYIRLCYDCATLASLDGNVLKYFTGDICYYHTKHLDAQYMGESRLNDKELKIYCWQDKYYHLILHFRIEKQDNVIFRCSVTFYPSSQQVTSKL